MSDFLNTYQNVQLLTEVSQLRIKIDHAIHSNDPVKFRQHVEKLVTIAQNWHAVLSKEIP